MVYLGRQTPSPPFFRVLSHLDSSVFNDFGSKFTIVDPTGEEPLTGMIVSVEKVCSPPPPEFKTRVLTDYRRTRRAL